MAAQAHHDGGGDRAGPGPHEDIRVICDALPGENATEYGYRIKELFNSWLAQIRKLEDIRKILKVLEADQQELLAELAQPLNIAPRLAAKKTAAEIRQEEETRRILLRFQDAEVQQKQITDKVMAQLNREKNALSGEDMLLTGKETRMKNQQKHMQARMERLDVLLQKERDSEKVALAALNEAESKQGSCSEEVIKGMEEEFEDAKKKLEMKEYLLSFYEPQLIRDESSRFSELSKMMEELKATKDSKEMELNEIESDVVEAEMDQMLEFYALELVRDIAKLCEQRNAYA